MFDLNFYSKYYSQINLYFHLLLETNYYRYTFLTNLTTLKKHKVLGYNIFSRVKGFSTFLLNKNVLNLNYNYLYSKTLSSNFFFDKKKKFDYFNYWSDSFNIYQDSCLKDIFVSLNKNKKFKSLDISLDYSIIDNNINNYNLNINTNIIYIHKFDLLYSLNFNLFYNVKKHLYFKIWLLNNYLVLNNLFLNSFLGKAYWYLNFDFSYFFKIFNFMKLNILINSFKFMYKYYMYKFKFLDENLYFLPDIKLKKESILNKLQWQQRLKSFYPLNIFKEKNNIFKNFKLKNNKRKYCFNLKNSISFFKKKGFKYTQFLVKKVFNNKFSRSIGYFNLKIYKLNLKYKNFKIKFLSFYDKFKIVNNNIVLFLIKIKTKINQLFTILKEKLKKYKNYIEFLYFFFKNRKNNINKRVYNLYYRNRKYIKQISSYLFYYFKNIYKYFKINLSQSWQFRSRLYKYLAINIMRNIPKKFSKDKFLYTFKNFKFKILSVISNAYQKFKVLKKKVTKWKNIKKNLQKKMLKDKLNYKLYIKKTNFYHRIPSFSPKIKLTPKMRFLIEKRAFLRKTLHKQSKGIRLLDFSKINHNNLLFNKKYNIYKLKSIDEQNSVVLTILKKRKHPYYNHLKVLHFMALHLNIPYILKELVSPYILHSFKVLKNINKYDIINLPEYVGSKAVHNGIIPKSDKKILKTTFCKNKFTRGVYFDLFKSKRSIYELLGIDVIIDYLKYFNKDKKIIEYKNMYKQRLKRVPEYFGGGKGSIKTLNKFFFKKIKEIFYDKSVTLKNAELPKIPLVNFFKIFKKRGNNEYLKGLLKNKRNNKFFLKLLKVKGNNPYFFKILKNLGNNLNFVKILKKENPEIIRALIENAIIKGNSFKIKSKLDFINWRIFDKIFNYFNNIQVLYKPNLNLIYLGFKNYYSFIFIYFLNIFYKFIVKLNIYKKFKGFSSSLKRSYRRFLYRLKFRFIKRFKLIRKNVKQTSGLMKKKRFK